MLASDSSLPYVKTRTFYMGADEFEVKGTKSVWAFCLSSRERTEKMGIKAVHQQANVMVDGGATFGAAPAGLSA